MRSTYTFPRAAALIAMLGALAVGCGELEEGPTAIETAPRLAVGDRYNHDAGIEAGVVYVCAIGLGDGPSGEAVFSASATGGDVATSFSVPWWPYCYETWNATDGSGVDVTATLESASNDLGDLEVQRIFTFVGDEVSDPTITELLGVSTATVSVSSELGAALWFKLVLSEDDDNGNGGGAGCTPGFWRQEHHFEYWEGYSPGDSFAGAFGVVRAGTLFENVNAGGGQANALARHAVAALLNASSSEVSYDLAVAEVIGLVQAAFATGNFNAAKNLLEAFNEQGCTVDKSN